MLIIIKNEQHSLLEAQKELLKKKGKEVKEILIPAEGLSKKAIEELAEKLIQEQEIQEIEIVMVSPIPLLIKKLALQGVQFQIFFNERREKKELPNGKVISVVAQEGWELV